MDILVIAAHPDDEILGCGGVMSRRIQEGARVHVLILGEGVTSRSNLRELANRDELVELQDIARAANSLLGVTGIHFESFPDNRFDTVPLLEITKKIEEHIDAIHPDVVYVQHGGDLNIDHAITFRAAMTAVRPMKESCVRSLYAYEVASSTEWSFGQFSPIFQPNYFVNISETLGDKLKALGAYQSELRDFPHPRSIAAVKAQAAFRGAQVGFKAAEAFQMIWQRN